MRGEILHVDRFGNAITNFPCDAFEIDSDRKLRIPGGRTCKLAWCYGDGSPGQPVVVPGSSGFWEIAMNGGSAATSLGLIRGTPILAET